MAKGGDSSQKTNQTTTVTTETNNLQGVNADYVITGDGVNVTDGGAIEGALNLADSFGDKTIDVFTGALEYGENALNSITDLAERSIDSSESMVANASGNIDTKQLLIAGGVITALGITYFGSKK